MDAEAGAKFEELKKELEEVRSEMEKLRADFGDFLRALKEEKSKDR